MEEAVTLFSRAKFDRSTVIDNKYFPVKHGTRHVYKGSTQEGNERIPHRVVWTVAEIGLGGWAYVFLRDRRSPKVEAARSDST